MSEIKELEFEIKDLKRKVESLEVDLKREKSRTDVMTLIPGLYYKYKNRSDEEIQKYLERVNIVIAQHKGIGTEFGYYPLNKKSMDKIIKEPRRVSLSFDATETSKTPIKDLKEYKKIKYLVKSSSRFFLKPDIGEIIDQLVYDDYLNSDIKAICFDPKDYETLPGTDGEHFIMTATLLCGIDSKYIRDAVNELHQIEL